MKGEDAFCGGVGTAGMLVGVGRALRQAGSQTRIVALEPATSAVMSNGKAGARIEGIGIGFVPPLLRREDCDEVQAIEEEAARQTARRLAKEKGIFVGTSTGLNVMGAIHSANELGSGHRVATVAVDTGLKYLAGDLYI